MPLKIKSSLEDIESWGNEVEVFGEDVYNYWEKQIIAYAKGHYEWWEVNNFEPRYVQYWTDDGVTEIDYGFHHMFYYIVECLI